LLKDEQNPVQVSHPVATGSDLSKLVDSLKSEIERLEVSTVKLTETPSVGHELFKTGTLTSKVPQFLLLEAGNPEPPTVLVSPLYQITLDPDLRRAQTVSGD
jgi:hypothetical protein